MADIIIILVVLIIVALAAGYIIRAKKSGQKCIGCPAAREAARRGERSCCGNCSSCSGCGHE